MRRIGLVVVLAVDLLGHSVAGAQQAVKLWRIGFLSPYSADYDKDWRAALRYGLRDLGYVEGRTSSYWSTIPRDGLNGSRNWRRN